MPHSLGWSDRDRPSLEAVAGDADLAWLHHDPRWTQWLDTEREKQARQGCDPALVLTDRVQTMQGNPRADGTQIVRVDGMLQPAPIEDVAHPNARRAAGGLGTMAEYVARGERQMHRKIQWPPMPAIGK